jgi:hypothetical protein
MAKISTTVETEFESSKIKPILMIYETKNLNNKIFIKK